MEECDGLMSKWTIIFNLPYLIHSGLDIFIGNRIYFCSFVGQINIILTRKCLEIQWGSYLIQWRWWINNGQIWIEKSYKDYHDYLPSAKDYFQCEQTLYFKVETKRLIDFDTNLIFDFLWKFYFFGFVIRSSINYKD